MSEKSSLDEVHLDELLAQVLERGCDTLHLEAGRPPCVRRGAEETEHELDEYERCKPQHIQSMLYDIVSDEMILRFERELKLSLGHRVGGVGFIVMAARDGQGSATVSCRVVSSP